MHKESNKTCVDALKEGQLQELHTSAPAHQKRGARLALEDDRRHLHKLKLGQYCRRNLWQGINNSVKEASDPY